MSNTKEFLATRICQKSGESEGDQQQLVPGQEQLLVPGQLPQPAACQLSLLPAAAAACRRSQLSRTSSTPVPAALGLDGPTTHSTQYIASGANITIDDTNSGTVPSYTSTSGILVPL